MSTASTIDTGKVTDRRKLRFKTPAEMLADVDRIVAAERAGTLRRTGNWTAGQAFNHLATWIDYAYTGPPLRPPLLIKFIMKRLVGKKRFLYGAPRVGVRIPRVPNGTLATEPLPLDEGAAKLRSSWARLQREAPTQPNVLFGPMTHDEWISMHLRHAEGHLGFLHP